MNRFSGFDVAVELPVFGGHLDVFFETNKQVYVIECKRNQSADETLALIDMKKYAKRISSHDKPGGSGHRTGTSGCSFRQVRSQGYWRSSRLKVC